MGFWNDGIRSRSPSRAPSHARSRSRSSSRSRKHSRKPSHVGSTHGSTHDGSSNKPHYTSRPSFARSASSFFSVGGGGSQSHSRGPGSHSGRSRSYTSAQPRRGFVAKIRKFLRQLYEYMRRHPVKVFFLVIMPLITGGALTKLLSVVGIRLPRSVENMVGSSMNRGVGQNDRYFARGGARDFSGGSALPGMVSGMTGGGVGDAIQGALGIAKMFL